MPEPLGAIGLRAKGGLVGAFRSGFAYINLDTGAVTPSRNVDGDPPETGSTTAMSIRAGGFWAGTMDDEERAPTGHLYRLDPDGNVERFDTGFVVTNGIDWSSDGHTLYFIDCRSGTIWAYDFDMEKGRPRDRRLFAQLDAGADGYPDGL